MNPTLLAFAASLFLGIGTAALPFTRKSWQHWFLTLVCLWTVTTVLSYLQTKDTIVYLLGSEVTLIFFGNLIGPMAFALLGLPKKPLWQRSVYTILGLLGFGSALVYATLTLKTGEDGRPFEPQAHGKILVRAEQILDTNFTAEVENTTGKIRKKQGPYRDEKGENPVAVIAEKSAQTSVEKGMIGPLFHVSFKGKPTCTQARATERTIAGKTQSVILIEGSATFEYRLTPFYYKDEKPTWDPTQIVNLTLPFEAAFRFNQEKQDIELLYYQFTGKT